MRIVLFNPAPRSGWQVQRRIELPLGLLCVATPLDRAGWDVCIVEEYGNRRWRTELVEALRAALGRQAAGVIAGSEARREVTVMAEKSLPYSVLRKIVASSSAAENTKVSLAVVERELSYTGQPGA